MPIWRWRATASPASPRRCSPRAARPTRWRSASSTGRPLRCGSTSPWSACRPSPIDMMPFDDPEPEIPRSMAPGWMITFADLLSLLLTFFVLVFATTTVEQKDWRRVVQPISAYLTGRTITAPKVAAPVPAAQAKLDLTYVSTLLDRLVADVPPLAGSRVSRDEHRVVLTLR